MQGRLAYYRGSRGVYGEAPLAMLHGPTSHARMWDHIAPAVAETYRIIARDQRAHEDGGHPMPPA